MDDEGTPATVTESPPVSRWQGREGPCEDCAERESTPVGPEFVYAIGRLDVRFPTLGIEREFQQRLSRTSGATDADVTRGSQIRIVLEAHGHLAARVCYVFSIGGIPAYIVAPAGSHTKSQVMEAIEHSGDPDYLCVLVGRRGPMAAPDTCGGVLAPIVAGDQLYCFSISEWHGSLEEQLGSAIGAKGVKASSFRTVARELFGHITQSTENLGATDAHRGLNYAIMQHPGIFLAAAERAGKQILDRIETRLVQGLGSRRQVAVILTFVDVSTGVAERLFVRVDTTEEWPFVAEPPEGGRAPLGLIPFVESGPFGLGF